MGLAQLDPALQGLPPTLGEGCQPCPFMCPTLSSPAAPTPRNKVKSLDLMMPYPQPYKRAESTSLSTATAMG